MEASSKLHAPAVLTQVSAPCYLLHRKLIGPLEPVGRYA